MRHQSNIQVKWNDFNRTPRIGGRNPRNKQMEEREFVEAVHVVICGEKVGKLIALS